MALRRQGTALLLSSHALFHVDLFCKRTLWLHQGHVRANGDTHRVLPAYQEFLDLQSAPAEAPSHGDSAEPTGEPSGLAGAGLVTKGHALNVDDHATSLPSAPDPTLVQMIRAVVTLDGKQDTEMSGPSGGSTLRVGFDIQASAAEPSPRAAVVISAENGRIIGSTLSPPGLFRLAPADEAQRGTRMAHGPSRLQGQLCFELPNLPLNKGRYRVGVYLLCSEAHFVYAWSDPHVHINLEHPGVHQGPWLMPGTWSVQTPTHNPG
jgi:lipopolysaccharide transport system ATP-binding protein